MLTKSNIKLRALGFLGKVQRLCVRARLAVGEVSFADVRGLAPDPSRVSTRNALRRLGLRGYAVSQGRCTARRSGWPVQIQSLLVWVGLGSVVGRVELVHGDAQHEAGEGK
jgi:hypothetical protein